MSKLLERLRDPVRSGVYRVRRDAEIRDVLKGDEPALLVISLRGIRNKVDLLDQIARALRFPEWFGRNWDALKDSLSDLSWLHAKGHVLLLQELEDLPEEDLTILLEILDEVAAIRRKHGELFFGVFIDPAGRMALPPLFRGA